MTFTRTPITCDPGLSVFPIRERRGKGCLIVASEYSSEDPAGSYFVERAMCPRPTALQQAAGHRTAFRPGDLRDRHQ